MLQEFIDELSLVEVYEVIILLFVTIIFYIEPDSILVVSPWAIVH
jgi:hypothetical protein